eukprot:765700-Hanusia_phi.AAC.3
MPTANAISLPRSRASFEMLSSHKRLLKEMLDTFERETTRLSYRFTLRSVRHASAADGAVAVVVLVVDRVVAAPDTGLT